MRRKITIPIKNPMIAGIIIVAMIIGGYFYVKDLIKEHRDYSAAWEGTVMEKGRERKSSNTSSNNYRFYLMLKTPAGNEEKRYCQYRAYLVIEPGDYVIKKEGEENIPLPRDRKVPPL